MNNRYVVTYRNSKNKPTNYVENSQTKLLTKCDVNWNPMHVTGWSVNTLSRMDYVKKMVKVPLINDEGTISLRFSATTPNSSNTPKSE